jgi:hypothetical protein
MLQTKLDDETIGSLDEVLETLVPVLAAPLPDPEDLIAGQPEFSSEGLVPGKRR